MKIAIIGLEHLGVVTTACVAYHHDVKAWDTRPEIIERLQRGEKTWAHEEPGVDRSFIDRLTAHHLAGSLEDAIDDAEIVWITYDTPLDSFHQGYFQWVMDRIEQVFPHLVSGQILLISSQLRCGLTRTVKERLEERRPGLAVNVYYSPENIRRGRGLETFCRQKRVLIGATQETMPEEEVTDLVTLFERYTEKMEWLSAEAAEMSKHVLNTFLALVISFANEVGTLCQMYGVDPHDIENALKDEGRIGPGLPLRYGKPYSGGTLSRDVRILVDLARERDRYLPLLETIAPSNELHTVRCEVEAMQKRSGTQEVAAGAD